MDIWGVLEYTASATVVALLIWLVKLVFHDKLDARWHYFIWLVLLVRLVMPVRVWAIPASLSIFQEIPVGRWMEMGRIIAQKKGYQGLTEQLFRIYLLGAAGLGGFYLILWAILRIQVALAPSADEDTRRYVDGIAAKYGLRSCRDIRFRKGTPCICGLLRPVLVIPPGERTEEAVILHELLHKRYKDVLVNIGLHAVRVVNWFNPLIWLVTSVVQNDSEALCDQRVLERRGEESAREYGELLITMGEGKQSPVKVGTSNMAGSYRNMKTRIRRIRDFRKVPEKIGLVTFCITLMLAVAGIGSSAQEAYSFQMPVIDSGEDLERALLYARCYHAHTPEEAVYLFLRAYEERSTVYRMAVMPEAEISRYEEFARRWYEAREVTLWENLVSEAGERYPAYFPRETTFMKDYRIYNLTCDGEKGSAVVCAVPDRGQGEEYVEWRLSLVKEDGWKVWLDGESERMSGEYRPEALLAGSRQLGDFLVELSGYNEGRYEQFAGSMAGVFYWQSQAEEENPESYPQHFSMEYKHRAIQVTYQGTESLEGKRVRIETGNAETDVAAWEQDRNWDTPEEALAVAKAASGDLNRDVSSAAGGGKTDGEDFVYSSSDGIGTVIFDGAELMSGEARTVYGAGTGFSQPGYGWKPGDRISAYLRIYIDDVLVQEGEVWSGNP